MPRRPAPTPPSDATAPEPGEPDALTGTEPLERPRGLVDEHAELAVLAACLTDAEAFYEVADRVLAEDFAGPVHQAIWRAMVALDAQGRAIDTLTVADELKRAGQLARVGGVVRLEDLARGAGRLEHLGEHAAMIVDRSLARQVARASRGINEQATDPRVTGEAALSFAEAEVLAIGKRQLTGGLVPMAEAVPAALSELAKARTSLLLGRSTGFRELDRLTGGFQGGQMITVAARPGMGKTSFALSLARSIAESSDGASVVFLSYEMGVQDLTIRLLANALGCELGLLRQGRLPVEMESDLIKAAQRLADLPLHLHERPPATIAGVRAELKRLARRQPVAAVVVDYLQLLSGDGVKASENRTQEVSAIARGLKNLARELPSPDGQGVPVIALSQLNRGLENRPDKRPQLSDLRESGEIEQASDCVFMLFRASQHNADADPEHAELIIAKQRNGVAGVSIPLRWHGGAARYLDRPEGWRPMVGAPAPTRGGERGGFF